MKQIGIFETKSLPPLAYRMRPVEFEQFIGQKQARRMIEQRGPGHLVLWGPPGCGKTTLAGLLAVHWKKEFFAFNAVLQGVPELRKIMQEIEDKKKFEGLHSILFIDEIHRFNKAQQDSLLAAMEAGDFILIGATTESPQTSLNKAVLSRTQTIHLNALSDEDIFQIIDRPVQQFDKKINESWLKEIASQARGDARWALNKLETLLFVDMNEDEFASLLKEDNRAYDKSGERHYDVISAFIKSIRGSDPDAAILWLAVMLDGGEDPVFIARRLVIAASEDVGNANPMALQVATSAMLAVQHIGMPEARIPLAQATTYLASSPKSNAAYNAINEAMDYVKLHPTLEVPTHLRNHHPDNKHYKYAHSYPQHYVDQQYSPIDHQFYQPTDLGTENNLKIWLEKLKEGKRGNRS